MFVYTQLGGKGFAILNEIRGNFAFGSRKHVYFELLIFIQTELVSV